MYVEIIPSEFADVVSRTFKQSSDRCGTIDDSFGYKTINDAIVESESIGFSLLRYVKPENLLFVFSQYVEAFYDFEVKVPPSPPFLYSFGCPNCGCDNKKCRGNEEYETDPRAIIFCKIMDGKVFKNVFWDEKQEGSNDTKRYEVSWSEFQKLKKRFHE